MPVLSKLIQIDTVHERKERPVSLYHLQYQLLRQTSLTKHVTTALFLKSKITYVVCVCTRLLTNQKFEVCISMDGSMPGIEIQSRTKSCQIVGLHIYGLVHISIIWNKLMSELSQFSTSKSDFLLSLYAQFLSARFKS